MQSIFKVRIQTSLTSLGKLFNLSHYFKVIVRRPALSRRFINSVIDSKLHDLMLPFLSPPLFTLCLLCLILLLCGKASKKREDVPSVHEGITARLFLSPFYPPHNPQRLALCMSLYFLLVCVPGDLHAQKYSSFVICLCCPRSCHSPRLRLSISVQFVPSFSLP